MADITQGQGKAHTTQGNIVHTRQVRLMFNIITAEAFMATS